MVTIAQARKKALSFEDVEELPHFDKASFRVRKKIFATLNEKENRMTVKLNATDQSVFCAYDETIIWQVPNAWGKQGWTQVNLKKVHPDLFLDLLTTSYQTVLQTVPQRKTKKVNMDQRLTFVTLGVHDLKAMKKFYTGVFGWEVLGKNPNITFFKLNGIILGLFPHEELAKDANVKAYKSGFKGVTFSINFTSEKEVDDVMAQLKKKKVTIVKSPEKVFWGGYSGYISDIEGNCWEIAYNPFLKMDKKGNVLSHP